MITLSEIATSFGWHHSQSFQIKNVSELLGKACSDYANHIWQLGQCLFAPAPALHGESFRFSHWHLQLK